MTEKAHSSTSTSDSGAIVGGRIFAIGDVHGCAAELETLIKKINPVPNDLVVFLGDYVDRGPHSRQVIDIVIALSARCEVVALRGNHEAMMIDFLERPESPGAGLFILNGGDSTLSQYTADDGAIEIPEPHINFLRNLRLTYQTDDYFFVHAGVPDIPLKDIDETEHEMLLLWSRYPFLRSAYKWEKLVVHGHTPTQEVELLENRVNVDTGCVYNGKLSAIELPSRRVIQVQRGEVTKKPLYPREHAASRISRRFSGRIPVQARRGADPVRQYETLNYNQFGILMRAVNQTGDYVLHAGDVLQGMIGDNQLKAVRFTGTVVRCEARGGTVVYGIRIDRVSGGAGGPAWIERPTEE